MHKKPLVFAAILLWIYPTLACAWWQDSWSSRKQITVDAGATGADIQGTVPDMPVLVRLHAGNFGFFAELADNGRDLRFVKDDSTPLPYAIEHLDALNEMGLIWVRLPQVRGGVSSDDFWLYYGNRNAPDGSDSKALYDVAQGLVYHFKEGETLPQDATAYASPASDSKAQIVSNGWIGAAAKFTGDGPITVNPAAQLEISADKGWTFSTWVKIDQAQSNASLLTASDTSGNLEITIKGTALTVHGFGSQGAAANLSLGRWQQVVVVIKGQSLQLYIDGMEVARLSVNVSKHQPTLKLGSQFVGMLDEVQVARTARSADWIKLSYRSQSPDFAVLNFGADETNSNDSDSHLLVIVQNVTIDGWVVIGLTGIMFLVVLMVILTKGIALRRISNANRRFLASYRQLDPQQPDPDRPFMDSNQAGLFSHSPLYQLYTASIREKAALQEADGSLLPEAWNLLQVKLDNQISNESLGLNSNMVLLTIAIAGGPFLGLLGTVVGVMITFAAIAATGDVNINTIAPGIAAALLATVAGLAVAIPALFAYNYLLTQIKAVNTHMRVFADEFLALLQMQAAQKLKRGDL